MMGPEESGEVRYAGFFDRTAAVILDLIIIVTLFYYLMQGVVFIGKFIGSLLFAGTAETFHEPMMPAMAGSALAGAVVFFLLMWVYSAGVTSSQYQATFGKMVMGLKVTDTKGNSLSFYQASVRYFAKILSTLILGIGLFMVAFSDRRQGLHDRIAGTVVVYKSGPVSVPADAGPTIIAATTWKQETADEESRSTIKKVALLISLPFILIIAMAVLSLVIFGAAASSHSSHPYVVAVTAQQPDSGHIIVTYQGGPDADRLTILDVSVDGKDLLHWVSPSVGEEREFAGTAGKDHVVITGTFNDGKKQVVYDSMI